METRRPQTEYAPLTHAEVEALRKDASRPDYGSKYYKPATVLALIATLDAQAFARR